jgi:CheY-like chemotaxis protein
MAKYTVLIVDDEVLPTKKISKVLISLGYSITGIVNNSAETMRKIEENRPDLVLMNLNIKDEKHNLEQLFEFYQQKNIPVVFMSKQYDKEFKRHMDAMVNSVYVPDIPDPSSLNVLIQKLIHTSGALKKDSPEIEELKRLKALQELDIINAPGIEGLNRIAEITGTFFHAPVALILLVDKTKIWVKASFGFKMKSIKRDSDTDHAILPEKLFTISGSKNKIINAIAPERKDLVFFASVPLITPQGYTIGSICFLDTENRYINPSAEKIFTNLAEITMDEIKLHSENIQNRKKSKLMHVAGIGPEEYSPSSESFMAEIPENLFSPIKRMSTLIKDTSLNTADVWDEFLTISLMENGSLKLNKIQIDLAEIAIDVIETYRKVADRKNQMLKTSIESHPVILADKERMKEVFDNLISNAIKYSPEDTLIEIGVLSAEEKAYFEVRDQGQGLTEEDKSKLFVKFAKLSSQPTAGEASTRIGLCVAKKLVELHGGNIWAESEGKNMGSRFVVELPKL